WRKLRRAVGVGSKGFIAAGVLGWFDGKRGACPNNRTGGVGGRKLEISLKCLVGRFLRLSFSNRETPGCAGETLEVRPIRQSAVLHGEGWRWIAFSEVKGRAVRPARPSGSPSDALSPTGPVGATLGLRCG